MPLHFACKSGNMKLFEYLIDECNCGTEILRKTADNWICLHYACECGCHFIVRELLRLDESHSSINFLTNNNETPLHLACKNNNIDAVRVLLSITGIQTKLLDFVFNINIFS